MLLSPRKNALETPYLRRLGFSRCPANPYPLSLVGCRISHLFSRARKKGFSFFACGGTLSRTVPKTAGCLFSTRKSRSEAPERGDFGEENCLGKSRVDRGKKGKKDAQKNVGDSRPEIKGWNVRNHLLYSVKGVNLHPPSI